MDNPKNGSYSCASEMRRASRPSLDVRLLPRQRASARSIWIASRSCLVSVTPLLNVLVRVPTRLTRTKPSPAVVLPMTRIGSLNWDPTNTTESAISLAVTLILQHSAFENSLRFYSGVGGGQALVAAVPTSLA